VQTADGVDRTLSVTVLPHALLRVRGFTSSFPQPIGAASSPAWLVDLLQADADVPLTRTEEVRSAVRQMLRHDGYKPTGRGKPASEYLLRAASEQALASINAAVDACNVVSLHSAFPISVIDLDRARLPFRIATAGETERYVFNASGQEIELAGLLCLMDDSGPCANAVKDAQRTKTGAETRQTLSIIWGCEGFDERLNEAERWYRSLLERAGAATAMVTFQEGR
jgi:DNA/RNA-binding domain of Phe-tRNA-synthetase-like protein